MLSNDFLVKGTVPVKKETDLCRNKNKYFELCLSTVEEDLEIAVLALYVCHFSSVFYQL